MKASRSALNISCLICKLLDGCKIQTLFLPPFLLFGKLPDFHNFFLHSSTLYSITFTYKEILPDPDISGLSGQTGKFACFQYSI